ncbi:Protein kinase, catalytic domain-containing protein [Artemisia annua]|uniref:Protein kinase, catalytic domain-containing protein n=1 Tax=Artemisia annua TaxID=35608 RepID=A0A2U1L6Z8_ARTAN|nr:Protein kinase, catalytic domain-containing protein [Artemisia annua]
MAFSYTSTDGSDCRLRLTCRPSHGNTDLLKDVIRYSRPELEVAYEDFSNIIGSSSDSIVYKGNMKGGPKIAVISLNNQEEHWKHERWSQNSSHIPYKGNKFLIFEVLYSVVSIALLVGDGWNQSEVKIPQAKPGNGPQRNN